MENQPTLPPSSGLYSFHNTVYHVAIQRTKWPESAVKFSVKYLNSTKSRKGVKIAFFRKFSTLEVAQNKGFSLKKNGLQFTMKALQWKREIFTVDFRRQIRNVAKISAQKIFEIKSYKVAKLADFVVV